MHSPILHTVVSGGQTGADQGALDAALKAGHPCGGWCPRGRRSEDGRIPDKYPLTEHASESYQARTEANVADSDGTLVFTVGEPTGGTRETVDLAVDLGRPCLLVDLEHRDAHDPGLHREIWAWARDHHVGVLNVAGPRASKNPEIRHLVEGVISGVLALGREGQSS